MSPEQARGQPVTSARTSGVWLRPVRNVRAPATVCGCDDQRRTGRSDRARARLGTAPRRNTGQPRSASASLSHQGSEAAAARYWRSANPLEQDSDTADVAPRSERRRVAAIAASCATATELRNRIRHIRLAAFGSVRVTFVRPFRGSSARGNSLQLRPGRTFFALSPNGSQLAFVANSAGSTGRNRLWLRAVTDLEARPLPGTEAASSVFWSPDGLSLAFFAERKWMRIDLCRPRRGEDLRRRSAFQPRHLGSGVILLGRPTERRSTLSRQRAAIPFRFCPLINRRAKCSCTGRGSSQMGSASCTRRASMMARVSATRPTPLY